MTNRLGQAKELPIMVALTQLHRAGWNVGDFATRNEERLLVWVVTGANGENLIRAEGPTSAAAWVGAIEQARSLGMLDRSTGDAPEGGDEEPLDPGADPWVG